MIPFSQILFFLGSLLLWGGYWVPFGFEVYDNSLFFGEVNKQLLFTFPYAFLGIYSIAVGRILEKPKLKSIPKQADLMIYSLSMMSLSLFLSTNSTQSLSMLWVLLTIFMGFCIREKLFFKNLQMILVLGVGTLVGTLVSLQNSEGVNALSLSLGWLLFIFQIHKSHQVSSLQKIGLFLVSTGGLFILKAPLILLVLIGVVLVNPVWFFQVKRPTKALKIIYGTPLLIALIFSLKNIAFSFGNITWGVKELFLGTGAGQYFTQQALGTQDYIIEESIPAFVLWFYEWGILGVLGLSLLILIILKIQKRESSWVKIVFLIGALSADLLLSGNNFMWWALLLFVPFENPIKQSHSHETHPKHS